MRNTLVVGVWIVLALLSFSFVGCGEDSAAGEGGSEMPTMAYNFRDGAPKYYDEQKACPVCGGQPIKEDVYVDHQMKRIYFDKEQCAKTFEENPQKYIDQWMERVQKEQQQQTEEMRTRGEGSQ